MLSQIHGQSSNYCKHSLQTIYHNFSLTINFNHGQTLSLNIITSSHSKTQSKQQSLIIPRKWLDYLSTGNPGFNFYQHSQRFYNNMKTIATALCLLAFLSITVLSEPTLVSYIVDVQEQKRQDYLQVTFSTNAEHEGLEAAVDQAQKEAQNLKQQAEQICNRLTKKSKECKKAVQIGNVKIEPSYKEVKKDKVYEKITASFEVTITWKDIKNFGAYIDQLLKVEGIIIEKIQWKADQDLLKNKFLKQSLQKGEALCAELGKKFKQVVNMQQLREKPKKPEPKPEPQEGEEQQQEEEQPKEEQQEEQQESISYKITLSCDGKAELKKKKK